MGEPSMHLFLRQAVRKAHLDTKTLWAGEEQPQGPGTQIPIGQSITFGHDDLEEWPLVAWGQRPGHLYSRNTNPTVAVFEDKVRIREGAEAATHFASSIAAISNTLFSLLRLGQRVVTV